MGFLGYQKDEIREYNDKRCCGLWFAIIGVVIIISAYVCFSRLFFSNAELENDLVGSIPCCWTSLFPILFCAWSFNDWDCYFMFC